MGGGGGFLFGDNNKKQLSLQGTGRGKGVITECSKLTIPTYINRIFLLLCSLSSGSSSRSALGLAGSLLSSYLHVGHKERGGNDVGLDFIAL